MKLKQYLYSQLSITFFPIFLGLFFITSIIFLVKIASLTSVITMSFFELLMMFSYVIPNIIFYTLPISFFISLVISLSKLSSEYELIVITSFGLNPIKILKIFLPITILVSALLLIVSVALIPKAKHLTDTFLYQKKKEANFNIKASEFGQKFGDWLIYIRDKKDNVYKDVRLFKTQNSSDQFILSKKAILNNEKGELSFVLSNGKSFSMSKDKVDQIDFSQMNINDSLSNNKSYIFINSYEYWKEKYETKSDMTKLIFYVLVSFFPIISLFLVISFSYYNPRYEKNKAVVYAIFSLVIYYILSDLFAKKLLFNSLYILPVLWFFISFYFYKHKVSKVY